MKENQYLNLLKESNNTDVVEEGFIKGLGSEFKNMMDDFKGLADLFHSKPDKVMPRIKTTLAKFKQSLNKIELNPEASQKNWYMKYRTIMAHWRYYIFLNDPVYKKQLNNAKGKKSIGVFDISFKKRIIPEIYEATTTQQLIQVVDKYEKRVEDVYKLFKRDTENKALKQFMQMGLWGLRDLMITIRMVASYKAK